MNQNSMQGSLMNSIQDFAVLLISLNSTSLYILYLNPAYFCISRIELSFAYLIGTVPSSFLLTWAGKMYDQYGARIFVSFGFAIAPVSFDLFIEEFSWKGAYLVMSGSIAIFFSIFVFLFFRDNPEDFGLNPDGEITVNPNPDVIVKAFKQFTLEEARRTCSFWLFSIPLAIYALYITGFTFHLVSIFENVGLTKEKALSVFLPMSFVSVLISFAGGWLSDKIKSLNTCCMQSLLGR
ncbi:MAG: MFS transporter [Bacteroidota bacterium]|nr:MFS transporter [Bacteroidota bacterium]